MSAVFPFTIPALLHVMPRSAPVIAAWIGPLEQSMLAFGIRTPTAMAMWLANIAHESVELTKLREDMNYRSAARLRAVFPRHFTSDQEAAGYVARGPQAIASKVYAGRLGNGNEASGDGWKYRAAGPIGVTFKSNMAGCSVVITKDANVLVNNPEFLVEPDFGAASAAWYWDMHDLNRYADADDFDGVCDAINIGRKTITPGDSNGYADRLHYYKLAQEALL